MQRQETKGRSSAIPLKARAFSLFQMVQTDGSVDLSFLIGVVVRKPDTAKMTIP
jgi:hypothetical protein